MIWLAFQRAVNVGKRKYPMAELREVLEQAGFDEVATHIQTGNIRLGTSIRSVAKLTTELESVFLADRGFEVPVVLFTPRDFAAIAADCDTVEEKHGAPEFAHYVELLAKAPTAAGVEVIEDQPEGQRAVVSGRAVHLLYDVPYGESKPPNAATKRALGVSTNRNAKVVRAIAGKWC